MDVKGLAVIAAVLLGSCAHPGVLRVGVDPHNAPMEYRNDDDSMAGFDLDLMRAVAEAEGLRVEFAAGTWSGLFAQVEDGGLMAGLDQNAYDAVISSVVITNERRVKFPVSQPYLDAGRLLIVPWDSHASTLDDLGASSVGVEAGSLSADIVHRTYNARLDQIRTYGSVEKALEDLLEHRIGGVVAGRIDAAQAFFNNAALKAGLRMTGPVLNEDQTLGIFVKSGNDALLAKINDGLDKVRASGRYNELLDRWALR